VLQALQQNRCRLSPGGTERETGLPQAEQNFTFDQAMMMRCSVPKLGAATNAEASCVADCRNSICLEIHALL
jgi:hypothetical protein